MPVACELLEHPRGELTVDRWAACCQLPIRHIAIAHPLAPVPNMQPVAA